VEEALIEMYLAGISMRRVEDITEALFFALFRKRVFENN
jgi:transposase-like protein